jgi:hypothetical protein
VDRPIRLALVSKILQLLPSSLNAGAMLAFSTTIAL